MSKKVDIEYIHKEFNKEGYILLTDRYINNKQKLNYICPIDHAGSITFDRWSRGQRCKICNDMKRKQSLYNKLKVEFEKEGYKLISNEYKSCNELLEFICPKGHKSNITARSWNREHRCRVCAGVQRKNYSEVVNFIKNNGYLVLSNSYINCTSKLTLKCPKGHIYKVSWDHFYNSGYRCSYCSIKRKKTIEFIRKQFEKENYILLTKRYENSSQKLDYICSEGHKHSITWHNWQSGCRCPYCAGAVSPTIEFIKESFEKENYTLLTREYKNSYQKLDYICSKGHKRFVDWHGWKKGQRCSVCANIIHSIRVSGSGNPAWKGGISKEPYCQDWTKEYKEFIKERDGYKCLNPYCFKKEGRGSELGVHHINYNKKVCAPENLIAICRSCNVMANKDRDWHQEWYQIILSKKYKYNY